MNGSYSNSNNYLAVPSFSGPSVQLWPIRPSSTQLTVSISLTKKKKKKKRMTGNLPNPDKEQWVCRSLLFLYLPIYTSFCPPVPRPPTPPARWVQVLWYVAKPTQQTASNDWVNVILMTRGKTNTLISCINPVQWFVVYFLFYFLIFL